MKHWLLFLTLISSYFGVCQGWEQQADLPADGRDDGVAFSIEGKGYVVTGNQPGFGESNRLWCFDPTTDSWSEKAVFPGEARQYAGAFVLQNKGYVMCGYSSGAVPLKDVWQYDPSSDSWQQMKDFEGVPRWTFFNFIANGYGYIGAGATIDSSVADCWKYHPNSDDWSRIADYPGGRMREVIGISMGNHCFAGSGLNVNPLTFSKSFYQYRWEEDIWTPIEDFPGGEVSYIGAQGVGLSAVVGGGWGSGNSFKTNFYRLNLDGTWRASPSAPIQGWRGMSTFSFDGKVYFVCGLYQNLTRTSNLFSLKVEPDFFPMLFPNPSTSKGKVYYLPNSQIIIYNQIGAEVLNAKSDFDGFYALPDLPAGVYIIQFPNGSKASKELRWLVR